MKPWSVSLSKYLLFSFRCHRISLTAAFLAPIPKAASDPSPMAYRFPIPCSQRPADTVLFYGELHLDGKLYRYTRVRDLSVTERRISTLELHPGATRIWSPHTHTWTERQREMLLNTINITVHHYKRESEWIIWSRKAFRFWDSSDALMFFVRFLVWFSKDPGVKEEQQM